MIQHQQQYRRGPIGAIITGVRYKVHPLFIPVGTLAVTSHLSHAELSALASHTNALRSRCNQAQRGVLRRYIRMLQRVLGIRFGDNRFGRQLHQTNSNGNDNSKNDNTRNSNHHHRHQQQQQQKNKQLQLLPCADPRVYAHLLFDCLPATPLDSTTLFESVFAGDPQLEAAVAQTITSDSGILGRFRHLFHLWETASHSWMILRADVPPPSEASRQWESKAMGDEELLFDMRCVVEGCITKQAQTSLITGAIPSIIADLRRQRAKSSSSNQNGGGRSAGGVVSSNSSGNGNNTCSSDGGGGACVLSLMKGLPDSADHPLHRCKCAFLGSIVRAVPRFVAEGPIKERYGSIQKFLLAHPEHFTVCAGEAPPPSGVGDPTRTDIVFLTSHLRNHLASMK